MTLAMPDAIYVKDLPGGYAQYLGYADGHWPTAAELRAKYPAAHVISLTVTGAALPADGIDCEPGNPDAHTSVMWVRDKLTGSPNSRPVIYASTQGTPGYGMPWVLTELNTWGIPRGQVRLISAHYGAGQHICGPATCHLIDEPMDGTQWTDKFAGNGGALIDMSALRDDFFGGQPPAPGWTEQIVKQLTTVQQGMTGEAVRTAQGALTARHELIAVDGIFGPATDAAVRHQQGLAHLVVDGIVGQQTWPVLLGVA